MMSTGTKGIYRVIWWMTINKYALNVVRIDPEMPALRMA
jgi:hypothetical protein